MKANYRLNHNNAPCTKIQITFIVQAADIEAAMQDLLEWESCRTEEEMQQAADRLTKEQIEKNLRDILRNYPARIDEVQQHGYDMLKEVCKATARRLYPDFYETK